MSAFVTVSVGRAGTAAANVRYMTRERATEGEQERVWTHNVPEHAAHPDYAERGISYKERTADLREYARQLEEDERERPQRGAGKKRTHYRVIYSFDREVADEKAREMVDRHLAENFPKARAIAALHRDTDNTHVHVQVAARSTDDKKLHFNNHTHRRLDERWARIYGREFGQQHEREHLAKKEEWRAYMREARLAKEHGRELPQRPQRVAHERNQVQERRMMHAKQYGLEYAEQTRVRNDQRPVVERAGAAQQRERSTTQRVEQGIRPDQHIARAVRGHEPGGDERRAERRPLRATDRAVGGQVGRSDRDGGASLGASRSEDARNEFAHDEAGAEPERSTSKAERVQAVDRTGEQRNEVATPRERAEPRELDGRAADTRLAHSGNNRLDSNADEHRSNLRDQDDLRAGGAENRAERELGSIPVNNVGRDAGAHHRERESQTAATRPAERPGAREHLASRGITGDHTEPDARSDTHTAPQQSRTLSAHTVHERERTAAEVLQMMNEATRPTIEREGRERTARAAAEQARAAAEREQAEAAAREHARVQAAREEQLRQAATERYSRALDAANKTVERELREMLKEHGREALGDPQTVTRLAQTLERTLGEHDTKLKELGLTREQLGEQVKSYVERIRQDPESFRQRMEPGHTRTAQQERTLQRERGYDRGDFGFSR